MNFYEHTLESLADEFESLGYKRFNARQVFTWVYKKQMHDFSRMSDIPKPLRAYLDTHYTIETLKVASRHESRDGTVKYLLELDDGERIEAVLMHQDYGLSLCVTSQVGCSFGCRFCASGLKKKSRDVSSGEMVRQVLTVEAEEDVRITHVVVMGTGEPFDNYDALMDFIDTINSPYALEIGARKITVSTVGVVPGIERFAEEDKQVNLAISLHAPNDTLRSRLMPINEVYPLKPLLESVKRYIEKTNRRVTFEYLLIEDVNDSLSHADELSDLLRGINCYVNLIPFNAVEEFNIKGSKDNQHRAFYDRLLKRGIRATSRREKGADIDAACGQLRTKS